jgi:hypothetical protein
VRRQRFYYSPFTIHHSLLTTHPSPIRLAFHHLQTYNMQQAGKTRKYLIATHGSFAKGIKSSLDIIIGPMDNVFLIEAYLD